MSAISDDMVRAFQAAYDEHQRIHREGDENGELLSDGECCDREGLAAVFKAFEVRQQWAVRWHLVGGGVDEQDCYHNARETAEQRARRLAARPPMGAERGEPLRRRIYTGPWEVVVERSEA